MPQSAPRPLRAKFAFERVAPAATCMRPAMKRVAAVGRGDHHVRRNQVEKRSITHALEQGPSCRPETSPAAERGLGHSCPASDEGAASAIWHYSISLSTASYAAAISLALGSTTLPRSAR